MPDCFIPRHGSQLWQLIESWVFTDTFPVGISADNAYAIDRKYHSSKLADNGKNNDLKKEKKKKFLMRSTKESTFHVLLCRKQENFIWLHQHAPVEEFVMGYES
jgi:hypothetical protein